MNKIFTAAICLMAVSCSGEPPKGQLTDLVDPMLGTETMWDEAELGYKPTRRTWGAEVFPGSSLPNAMVQLSPVTEFRAGAGYQYEDSVIYGFSHTNKGHWNLNYVPIIPITTDVTVDDYASTFSHSKESARPAYYQVYLDRYGVNVELTSTLRCGYHRYTFDSKSAEKRILINLANSNETVHSYTINQDGKNSFSGMQQCHETIYFYGVSNYDITHIDSIRSVSQKSILTSSNAPGGGHALKKSEIPVLELADNSATGAVELKIGFSFVSIEAAKRNLEAEMLSKSFEEVKAEGNRVWNELLSTIEIEGGSHKQQELFYSTLYRSMLWPVLRSDVNMDYTDYNNNIVNKGFHYYTDPSFWDDYRNKLVLLAMVRPNLTTDVIKSCIDRGEHSGFMPTFFHGDHASVYITGCYLRGIRDFNVESAYELMVRNATIEGPSRPFLDEYLKYGYVPEVDLSDLDRVEIHTDAKAAVTKTQEYAYDDYAVGLLAEQLGDSTLAAKMMERSKNYRNLYDSTSRFMRGRLESGEWVEHFDPYHPYFHYQFREATAWQSAFFAPHDTEYMVEMYGGKERFEAKLDSLFTIPWKGYEAHNVSGFIGQYCHGNQPDHSFPFLYTLIGKPAKTQKILDTLLNEFYTLGANDLSYSGMDDAGEMSSWYVLTSIGLYTYSPADAEYLVSVPLFDRVKFRLPNKATFTITKEGEGREMVEALYDGEAIDSHFISHSELERGRELVIKTKK